MRASDEPARSNEAELDTRHLESDLGARTARGGAITLASQAGRMVVTLGGAVVLARLLGPEEYGLAGMVAVATGLLMVFNEAGLSLATVQRERVTQAEVSGVFWLQLLISAAVAIVSAALSPLLAWVFSEPRVLEMNLALSTSFVVIGLYAQHQAILRRQMRFMALGTIELVAVTGGIASAITSAFLGAGYWALVIQPLAQYAITLPLTWTLCRWRPSWPAIGAGVRAHVDFSKHFLGYKLLEYVARSADRALLGWIAGAHVLGLYNRAYTILALPFGQIAMPVSFVVIPALSRLQANAAAFRALLTRSLGVLAWLTFPIMAYFVACAEDVVWLLLGPKWADAAGLFRFFAIGAVAMPMSAGLNWVLIPLGRTDRMLRWGMVSSSVGLATLIGAAHFGAEALATARALFAIFVFLGGMAYATRGTDLGLGQILRALRWQTIAAIAAGGAAAVTSTLEIAPLLRLLLGGFVVGAVFCAVICACGEWRPAVDFLRSAVRRQALESSASDSITPET